MNDRFIRMPEVVRMVGMSKGTIYKYVHKGEFPSPVYFGSRLTLWSERGIQEWMDKCKGRTSSDLPVEGGVVSQ
jgi:prophage regulatory protein